jgi:hypothetical protein
MKTLNFEVTFQVVVKCDDDVELREVLAGLQFAPVRPFSGFSLEEYQLTDISSEVDENSS